MSLATVVEVKDLKVNFYTYAGVVEALDGVNVSLREGEILGLVGETGSGKSVTSLSVMMLVPAPGRIEGGAIYVKNDSGKNDVLLMDDASLRSMRGKDISMIFQEPRAYLNPVYTVENQISEVILVHRKQELLKNALDVLEKKRRGSTVEAKNYRRMLKNPRSLGVRFIQKFSSKKTLKNEVRKEVAKVLKSVEIPDPERVCRMYPHELSGGMAQRALIAMALACNPKVLIADEPTTNLDVTVQAQILNLVRLLKRDFNSSILYITHDLGVVAQLCDRVAVMYAGNVVETADVFEIFGSPFHPYTRALLESIPNPEKGFKSIPGIVPGLINPISGCRFRDRCSYAMEICQKVKPQFLEVKKGHSVACYLYGGSQ
jgi:oligopeptide/dipeptide ABC transporter ATP-binding protein